MSQLTTNTPKTGVKAISEFLNTDSIKSKFIEILGTKGNGFIAAILTAVSQNDLLKEADPTSVYTCALMAASLDLPINSNLGMAYLIPYNVKQKDGTFKKMAQFQIGYKGIKQLAQRSGQFKLMTDAVVYEGQLIEENPLTGYQFDWKQKKSDKVIGFVSYFELINGFKSTLYLTVDDVKKHGAKYSKTFNNQYGVWQTEFDSMAIKTVVKLNLTRNAPLSIEMQRATIADQSVIKNDSFIDNESTLDVEYVDNSDETISVATVNETKEKERIIGFIAKSKTIDELKKCENSIKSSDIELKELYLRKEIDLCDDLTLIDLLGKQITPENLELIIHFDDKRRELQQKK